MKYLDIREIGWLAFSFFLFGIACGFSFSLFHLVKNVYYTIRKKRTHSITAVEYHLKSRKKAQKEQKISFSLFEMAFVVFVALLYFLFSFYFLDGALRLYTLALSIFGAFFICFVFKCLYRPLCAILYPAIFLIEWVLYIIQTNTVRVCDFLLSAFRAGRDRLLLKWCRKSCRNAQKRLQKK